jgi:DNA-binding MarR family transcriptional regulator
MTTLELERFLPYRLNRAAAAVSEQLREIYGLKHSLTIPEWRVLATLAQYPGRTADEVGRHAGLHKTKVSRAVHALYTREWIKREPDAEDLREEFLSLTAAGRRGYAAIVPDMQAFEERLLTAVGPPNSPAVLNALDMLEKALGLSTPALAVSKD